MREETIKFKIPISDNKEIILPIENGKPLYVLGANGVGKSALLQRINKHFHHNSKRILAHRMTWFNDNTLTMNASQKKQTEVSLKVADVNENSRYKDDFNHLRASISLFDLIDSENVRSRNISSAVDVKEMELASKYSEIISPINGINEILVASNIPIKISLEKGDQLFASKAGSPLYSIAELSDGERNALLIISDVLTADSDTIILIDEPERHLHRSIISPLLTTLFAKRTDCTFIISTHEIQLPIDYPDSNVLLVRDCVWVDKRIKNWDADLIVSIDEIEDLVKSNILGSKRKILFIEGETTSLDLQIYQSIYENISVIPKGNCRQVQSAVEGVRATENINWIKAFGLIDADDRSSEQIETLKEKGIIAIPAYSVEGLYCNLKVIRKIAENKAEEINHEKDYNYFYQEATKNIIRDLSIKKDLLCAKLCEKKLRNIISSQLPTLEEIQNGNRIRIDENVKDMLDDEKDYFDMLVQDSKLDELLLRYPLKQTSVLKNISNGFKYHPGHYEMAVRALIQKDGSIKKIYKDLLNPLTELIEQASLPLEDNVEVVQEVESA